LVTASADLTIKLWNVENRHCEGVLRGCSGVPVTLVWATLDDDSKKYIVSGQVDGNVTVWDVESFTSPTAVLDKHRSQISGIACEKSKNMLVTCGRDQLIAFWSLKEFTCLKVMPSFEEIECLFTVSSTFANWLVGKKSKSLIEDGDSFCLSGGQKGKLRLWNVDKMAEVTVESYPVEKSIVAPGRKIDAVHAEDKRLVVVQDDTIGEIKLRKALCVGGITIKKISLQHYRKKISLQHYRHAFFSSAIFPTQQLS
jgi:WD40 repeat protein